MQNRGREGRRRVVVSLFRVAGIILTTALVGVGCATQAPGPPRQPESYLLPGYSTYFAVDVQGNIELFEYVASELELDLGVVLGRTQRIAGGANIIRGEFPDVGLIAAGEYPKSGVQFALRRERNFATVRAEVDGVRQLYFTQDIGTLQVAVPESGRVYVSSGRMLEMLQDRPDASLLIDPLVMEILGQVGLPDGPAAAIVVPDPGSGFFGNLGVDAESFPIRGIILQVFPQATADDPLQLAGSVILAGEREAQLMGLVGRFFVLAFVRSLGLDVQSTVRSVEMAVEGSALTFAGIPMSADELVALVQRLSGEALGSNSPEPDPQEGSK